MKITLGFTGDTAFSEFTKELYKNDTSIDERIFNFLNSNDYNIINFESPVTESTITGKDALAHKSSPEALSFIKNKIKNPILSLANNHMMDFGQKGMKDTLDYIKNEQISYIGAGENEEEATNYIVLGADIKIAILSAQYKNNMVASKNTLGPAHNKHFKIIKNKIKKIKKEVDWVIFLYHGGEEFLNTPMPYTRRLYKKFLSWGADIVVAHHPHTVQGFEKIEKKSIFYSLGNFIFDTEFQRAQKGTEEGILLKIEFDKDTYKYESLPIIKDRKQNKITLAEKNIYFKDITINYKNNWKKEARRLSEIKNNKKKLKEYRNHYSINNLYIEKASCTNLVSFDELVKNNYIKELDKNPVFKNNNFFIRKFNGLKRRLENLNIRKIIYGLYAKIFK